MPYQCFKYVCVQWHNKTHSCKFATGSKEETDHHQVKWASHNKRSHMYAQECTGVGIIKAKIITHTKACVQTHSHTQQTTLHYKRNHTCVNCGLKSVQDWNHVNNNYSYLDFPLNFRVIWGLHHLVHFQRNWKGLSRPVHSNTNSVRLSYVVCLFGLMRKKKKTAEGLNENTNLDQCVKMAEGWKKMHSVSDSRWCLQKSRNTLVTPGTQKNNANSSCV